MRREACITSPSSTRTPTALRDPVSEVSGCFSAADTFEEIVPNAIEALSLFFEDSEPVPPRGLEAVREQVAEDIAKGAVLMMIPYVHDRKRVVR